MLVLCSVNFGLIGDSDDIFSCKNFKIGVVMREKCDENMIFSNIMICISSGIIAKSRTVCNS